MFTEYQQWAPGLFLKLTTRKRFIFERGVYELRPDGKDRLQYRDNTNTTYICITD